MNFYRQLSTVEISFIQIEHSGYYNNFNESLKTLKNIKSTNYVATP